MFSNPTSPDSGFDEGLVIQVDPLRKNCKVKTLRGQSLNQVQWTETVGNSSRGGDRVGPMMGDRVVLMYGLGYPLIFGFLPKPQSTDNAFPLNIDTNQVLVDTGDYSASGALIRGDSNKPTDILNGDRIISSEGGGFIGLLRAGAVVIRSSALSQIFMSKLDDVVKIVSRNWEHYTDVSTDIVKNFRGRVYRYIGYSNSFSETKSEAYRYHQYIGDTAAAEAVKANYNSPPGSIPTTNNILFKEQVTDGSEKMHRTVNTAGEEELLVTGGSGAFTRTVTTGAQVTISYGDQNTITVNNPVIKLQRSDGAVITMDSNGIRATFSSGEINMQNSDIEVTFSGAKTKLDNDGVYHTFGAHFVNVTSSGVQLG